jgi:hypothetical protein
MYRQISRNISCAGNPGKIRQEIIHRQKIGEKFVPVSLFLEIWRLYNAKWWTHWIKRYRFLTNNSMSLSQFMSSLDNIRNRNFGRMFKVV